MPYIGISWIQLNCLRIRFDSFVRFAQPNKSNAFVMPGTRRVWLNFEDFVQRCNSILKLAQLCKSVAFILRQ